MKNAFLIGAMKCGTNTLYHALRRHESVVVPKTKELDYFLRSAPEELYSDCFDLTADATVTLDGTATIPKACYVECEGAANERRFGLERAIERARPFMSRRVDFVLQIHPGNHWEEECIGRFEVFVRYVRASGYRFGLTEHLR